jgi:hypothetical protein
MLNKIIQFITFHSFILIIINKNKIDYQNDIQVKYTINKDTIR